MREVEDGSRDQKILAGCIYLVVLEKNGFFSFRIGAFFHHLEGVLCYTMWRALTNLSIVVSSSECLQYHLL